MDEKTKEVIIKNTFRYISKKMGYKIPENEDYKKIIDEIINSILDGYRAKFLRMSYQSKVAELNNKGKNIDIVAVEEIIDYIYETLPAKLSEDERKKLNNNKKQKDLIIKEATKRLYAKKVKSLMEQIGSKTEIHTAFEGAVRSVANQFGVTLATVRNAAKDFFKSEEPELYEQIINAETMTEEDYVVMAYKILKNNYTYSLSKLLPGYSKMMDYIKINRPDLYEQISEMYASHKAYSVFKEPISIEDIFKKYIKTLNGDTINVKELLAQVIIEFRVPISMICRFINSSTLFRKDNLDLIDEVKLKQYIMLNIDPSYIQALKWYFYDICEIEKDQTELSRRTERFYKFVDVLGRGLDLDQQIAYIIKTTSNNLREVKEKIKVQHHGEKYNLTQEDLRNLMKYVYKMALSHNQIDEIFHAPAFTKYDGFRYFIPETDEDIKLCEGITRLREYNETRYSLYKRH